MATKRQNSTTTVRVQLSLDPTSVALLDRISSFGTKGKNKSEVATRLLQDLLLKEGVELIKQLELTTQYSK